MAVTGNESFTLKFKNNNNQYVTLNPRTIKDQVIDFQLGKAFGPYILTLTQAGWQNNQQALDLAEIIDTDIPIVIKVLEGTSEEMNNQNAAYNLLTPNTGVESLNGQIKFTCTSVPTVDFKVQVEWTR